MDLSLPSEYPELDALAPHSCNDCRWIEVCCYDGSVNQEFDFTYDEVNRAASSGCCLFQRLIKSLFTLTITPYWQLDPPSLRVSISFNSDIGDPSCMDIEWFEGEQLISSEEDPDELQIFALEDSPAAPYISARLLNSNPASKRNIKLMRAWLRRCRQNHAKCRNARSLRPAEMPTRLVYVGGTGDQVRIETVDKERLVPYTAISYCWGGSQETTQTTKANFVRRQDGIPLMAFPETIRDAIEVTRRLELDYIWVDSICIVQDSEDDKNKEFPKMSKIYQGASVVISAAQAKCSDQGFLHKRPVKQHYGTTYKLSYKRLSGMVEETGSIILCDGTIQNSTEEPIDSRAWTMQEHKQALRLLRFGSRQVEWSCLQKHLVDGGSSFWVSHSYPEYFTGSPYDSVKLSRLSELPDNKMDVMLYDWTVIVEKYSACDLLRLGDRLPAFAAIAENFASATSWQASDYWAGLWRHDISMQLRWWRPKGLDWTAHSSEESGPSWSWASSRGCVAYGNRLDWGHDTLEVIGYTPKLKSQDFAYGEVISGCLAVKGYLREARPIKSYPSKPSGICLL